MNIRVLFGTETGNAEYCADELVKAIEKQGREVELVDMEDFSDDDLKSNTLLLIVTSTHGNGDPPANAVGFMNHLKNEDLQLNEIHYAVCGLGDSSFQYFAQCGKDFDSLLAKRGAIPIFDRIDCDEDYDPNFEAFTAEVIKYLSLHN